MAGNRHSFFIGTVIGINVFPASQTVFAGG
jgi:hypothetical protein